MEFFKDWMLFSFGTFLIMWALYNIYLLRTIFYPKRTKIFVFGSNLNGNHWGGSARHAFREFGAVWGQGIGLWGNSYAIPTLDENMRQLPLDVVQKYVHEFMMFVFKTRGRVDFEIVAIGCGVAGFKPEDIGPMFRPLDGMKNVTLAKELQDHIWDTPWYDRIDSDRSKQRLKDYAKRGKRVDKKL